MIKRFYDNLESYLQPNKVLILYGPRRVGKTTLLTNLLTHTKLKYKFDSGDDLTVQEVLSSQRFNEIIPYLKNYSLYALDEAQHVPNIGMALKIIVDQLPEVYVIVTGSSSLDLRGQIGEPLVGRKRELILYPISHLELKHDYSPYELEHLVMPETLVFGDYPEVISAVGKVQKQEVAIQIVNSYLLKDILEFERVKDSKTIRDLLKLIAFQIGNEVSLSELGSALSLDYKTVARYLDLMEKSFILYNLRGFARNLRVEVTKKSKYYFFDNGVRNALINNFNPLDTRDDVGKLWENFLVMERLKKQHYHKIFANNYFWRTWEKREIDWIEEREGKLFGFEFKWKDKKKGRNAWEFLNSYKDSSCQTITPDNYLEFIL